MDALVMCGGRGTRLAGDIEKPLVAVGDMAMVDRVIGALRDSHVDAIFAAVSPQAPATREHLAGGPTLIDTPGDGYVNDLRTALEAVDPPVVTVAADLPLLAGDAVDTFLDAAAGGSTSATVPAALKRRLGLVVEREEDWVPAGLNVVATAEPTPGETWRTWDARLAVNVNRRSEIAVASDLLDHGP